MNVKKYLKNIIESLNKECISKKTPNNDGYYNYISYHWELDDISLNIEECRNYCRIENKYSCYESSMLCDSCSSILEKQIRKPYNRTSLELNIEINKINEKIDMILEKLDQIHDNINEKLNENTNKS